MKLTAQSKSRISWVLVAAIAVAWGWDRGTATSAQLPTNQQESVTQTEAATFPTDAQWQRSRLIQTLTGHKTAVFSVLFVYIPQGQFLVSGGSYNDGQMIIWRLNPDKKVEQFRAQRTALITLAASPNSQNLLSAGDDGIINILDVTTRKTLGKFIGHRSSILDLAVTPDSRTFVSGGLDGIKVWELGPRRPLYELTDFGSPSYKLAIHPNGYLLASGNKEGQVQFWNLRTAKIISEFFPHQEQISGLTFTPDGKKLITSSYDRTVKVWDLDTGELLQTLRSNTQIIRAIALNPDGKTLASVGNDGIRLWNIETGKLLIILSPQKDWVQSVAFSPDGRFLATGSFDSTVKLWEAGSLPVEVRKEKQ